MNGYSFIRRKNGSKESAFTLLETTLTLALTGLVMSFLLISMHRIVGVISLSIERLRFNREFRLFYDLLITDCAEIALLQNQTSLELKFPPLNKEEYSLTLWKRCLKNGWADASSDQIRACDLHAVKYSYQRKTRTVMREVQYLNVDDGEVTSRQPAMLNRAVARNVESFELYPMDARGRRQVQWIANSSAGFGCVLGFRSVSPHSQQSFHAKIPVFKIGCEEPMDDSPFQKL